jgi:hypothetical protein
MAIDEHELLSEARQAAEAIGRLSENEESFRAAVDAFRAVDSESWQLLLERHELFPFCRPICHWISSKECVLLCLELCGPPRFEPEEVPDVDEFANVVARITADEELVELLATAITERDAQAWRELIAKEKLERFCHLLCHWACVVRCRLICELICIRRQPGPINLIGELQAAGSAIQSIAANKEVFAGAVEAVRAGDCELLRDRLVGGGFGSWCRVLCEWFCSWRCMLVCLPLCRPFPFEPPVSPISEMLEFARALATTAQAPNSLERLVAAVLREDSERFGALIKELQLERFCIQFCHWVCFLRCQLFCFCVCPPPDTIPLFTHVGQYHVDPIYGDFTADGTTTAGGYAFTGIIPLIGIMPDGTASEAVEYRFQVAKHPALAPVQDVVGPMIAPTKIGELEYWYWNGASWTLGSADYYVNNPGATATIPQQLGPPLTPSVNVTVKPGGWIEVPRENDLTTGGTGRFARSAADLVDLDTTQFTNEFFDLTTPAPGLKAGDTVPTGPPTAHSEAPSFRIFFESREVVGGAAVSSNQLDKIAFSNTSYSYTRHAEWAGGTVTTRTVCSLDIAELIAPGATGCDRLHQHLHALFTTYHPYLASVSVYFVGNAPLPASLSPPIVAGEADSGGAGHNFNISGLKPCAYVLWLTASVNLTRGWGLIGDATDQDFIAFCVA